MATTTAAQFHIQVAVEPCDDRLHLRLHNASNETLTLPVGFRLACHLGEYLPFAPLAHIHCPTNGWRCDPSRGDAGVLMVRPEKDVILSRGQSVEIILTGVEIPNEVFEGHFHMEASGFKPPAAQPAHLDLTARSEPPFLPVMARLLGPGWIPANGARSELRLRVILTRPQHSRPVNIAVRGCSYDAITVGAAHTPGWGLSSGRISTILSPPETLPAGTTSWTEVVVTGVNAATPGQAEVVLWCAGEEGGAIRLPFTLTAAAPATVTAKSASTRAAGDGRTVHQYTGGTQGVDVTFDIDTAPAGGSSLCWRMDGGVWNQESGTKATFARVLFDTKELEVHPSGWLASNAATVREILVAAAPQLIDFKCTANRSSERSGKLMVPYGEKATFSWKALCRHSYELSVGDRKITGVSDGNATVHWPADNLSDMTNDLTLKYNLKVTDYKNYFPDSGGKTIDGEFTMMRPNISIYLSHRQEIIILDKDGCITHVTYTILVNEKAYIATRKEKLFIIDKIQREQSIYILFRMKSGSTYGKTVRPSSLQLSPQTSAWS